MSQVSTNKLLTKPRRTKLNTSNMSEDFGEEKEDGEGPGAIAGSFNEEPLEVLDVAVKTKQRVPVTFFSGMPVLGQPIGTMPLYPSWSIHALGKYFSYSHSSGNLPLIASFLSCYVDFTFHRLVLSSPQEWLFPASYAGATSSSPGMFNSPALRH